MSGKADPGAPALIFGRARRGDPLPAPFHLVGQHPDEAGLAVLVGRADDGAHVGKVGQRGERLGSEVEDVACAPARPGGRRPAPRPAWRWPSWSRRPRRRNRGGSRLPDRRGRESGADGPGRRPTRSARPGARPPDCLLPTPSSASWTCRRQGLRPRPRGVCHRGVGAALAAASTSRSRSEGRSIGASARLRRSGSLRLGAEGEVAGADAGRGLGHGRAGAERGLEREHLTRAEPQIPAAGLVAGDGGRQRRVRARRPTRRHPGPAARSAGSCWPGCCC